VPLATFKVQIYFIWKCSITESVTGGALVQICVLFRNMSHEALLLNKHLLRCLAEPPVTCNGTGVQNFTRTGTGNQNEKHSHKNT
jgi:hypothetical protein